MIGVYIRSIDITWLQFLLVFLWVINEVLKHMCMCIYFVNIAIKEVQYISNFVSMTKIFLYFLNLHVLPLTTLTLCRQSQQSEKSCRNLLMVIVVGFNYYFTLGLSSFGIHGVFNWENFPVITELLLLTWGEYLFSNNMVI